MHDVEQHVPQLPPEVATDPNVWRAHNLHTLEPASLPYPPAWLAQAIENARAQARNGRRDDARSTLETALDTHPGSEFGAYREALTWVEAQNARKLVTLAAVWDMLRRADDPMRQSLAVRCEGFAYDRFGTEGLSVERGWAERVTRRMDLLPTSWREA